MSSRTIMYSVRTAAVFPRMFAALLSCVAITAFAQSPVQVTGSRSGGLALSSALGHSYEITQGAFITYNTSDSSEGAVYDFQSPTGATDSWIVRNSGTIGTNPNGSSPYAGFLFNTSGSSQLTNEATGYITSGPVTATTRAAVNFTSGWGDLVNRGIIIGPANGVRFGAGGTLENSGTIIGQGTAHAAVWLADGAHGTLRNAGGYIDGSAYGVRMSVVGEFWNTEGAMVINRAGSEGSVVTGAGGLIVNDASTIIAESTGGAVDIRAAASVLTTIRNLNGGLIKGTGQHGVYLRNNNLGGAAIENNASTIEATDRGISIGTGSIPDVSVTNAGGGVIRGGNSGIYAFSKITVINDATSLIEGNGSDVATGGIGAGNSGSSYGLLAVENSGTIIGGIKGVNLGLIEGNLIDNKAGGVIRSTVDYGAPGTLTSGQVGGGITSSANAAVRSSTINNAGLIEGMRHGIFLGNGADITNSGTIRATGQTVSAAIYFGATNASDSLLTLDTGSVLDGDVISVSTSQNRIALRGSGSEDSNFKGSTATSGFKSLTMAGDAWTLSGSVTLTGASSGALAVDSGTLTIANTIAFINAAGGVTVATGATLRIADGASLDSSVAGASAKIATHGEVFFDRSSDFTYNGIISGSGSVHKAGTNTLVLDGANTYAGDTIIDAGLLAGNIGKGTLIVNTSGTYRMNAASTVTFSGITGDGTVDLNGNDLRFDVAEGVTDIFDFAGSLIGGSNFVKTGAGTVELTSAITLANAFIKDGSVKFDDPAKLNVGTITLGDAGTAGLIEYAVVSGDWTKNIALTGGGGGFLVDGSLAFTGTATGSGDFVKSGSGMLDITGANIAATIANTVVRAGTLKGDTATIKGNASIADQATLEFFQATDASFAGNITGAGALHKTGAGTLTLNGDNAYGDTLIDDGMITGKIGLGTLTVNTTGTYKVGATGGTVSLEGILGDGTVDLNNNNLAFDVGAGATGTFAFAGTLTGGNDFIKTGDGTLDLTSAITLDNALIKAGTVSLDDQAKLDTTTITLGDAGTRGLIGYGGSADWTKNIALTGAGGGFSIDGNAAFTGVATGAADFVKSGTGTLDITGATMDNSANTVVDAGVLKGDATTIKGNASIASGATLEFSQSADATFSGNIDGDGTLRKTGNATLTLNGSSTYGDTIIDAGMLAGNIGLGSLTINASGTYQAAPGAGEVSLSGILGNGTLDLNNNDLRLDIAFGATGTFSFAGTLANGDDLIKTGEGTLDVESTLTGFASLLIKNGAVKVDDQAKLGTAAITLGDTATRGFIEYANTAAWTKNIALTGSGGGFIIDGNAAFTGAATGAADFVKSGTGTLDITGATMDAAITRTVVDAGVLKGNAATIRGDANIAADAILEFEQTDNAAYAGAISGAGAVRKTGAGTLNLTGANSHGNTIISQGVLMGALGTGTLTIETAGTYKVVDGQSAFTPVSNILGDGTIDLNTANLLFAISSGTTQYGFAGNYAGAGGNQFVKTGAGTLDLLTPVNLPGGASIEDGVVRVATQDALGNNITLGSTATAGLIDYTGATAWTTALKLTGSGGGFTVASGNDTQFTGAVTGGAPFVKAGDGRLDVTGASFNNAPGILVRSGTLAGDAQSMAASTRVLAGAVVEFNQTISGTYDGTITGAGNFHKTGDAVLTLTQPTAHTGVTGVSAGSLRAGAPNIWLASSGIITSDDGALDMGGYSQIVSSLQNQGALIFNATVNSAAGIIYGADSLAVTGAASGTGLIRLNLTEASPIDAQWTYEAALIEIAGANTSSYQMAERQVYGAYDWVVVPRGSEYVLTTALSPEVPAIGGLDAAGFLIGRASMDSLGQRLMLERGDNNAHAFQLWANGLYRQDNLANELYDGAKVRTNGIQLGADWNNKKSTANNVTIGFFCDRAETDMDLEGNTSSTSTKSSGVGFYASYRPGNTYFDIIVRTSREDYEIIVPGTPSFETEGTSIAASLEWGGRLPVEWSWHIEPQAQFVVQKHKVDNATDFLEREYAIDSADTLSGRVGVRLWREITLWAETKKLAPYIRASLVYDWDGEGYITTEGSRFKNDMGGSLGVLDIGASLQLAKWFVISADGGWYAGSRMNGYAFNATLSLRW